MNASLKKINVNIYTYRLGYCLHGDGSRLDVIQLKALSTRIRKIFLNGLQGG